MGWIGSADTLAQVTLHFATREEAEAYAQRHGIPFDLELPPPEPTIKPKAYADNFAYNRVGRWTH